MFIVYLYPIARVPYFCEEKASFCLFQNWGPESERGIAVSSVLKLRH